MVFSKSYVKYPIGLFFLIVLAKIVYIFVESGYSYDVLFLTTNSEFSREAIEALNERGHIIASVGFTLLFIPFLYWCAKKFNRLFPWIWLILLLSLSFALFYMSLNIFVDKVVEVNKDKRYEAYYCNLIKYGILNDVIYYNSFIEKSKMGHLDINDKILLTNIFLLLYADNNVIEKFREKGEKNAIALFIQKYQKDDFIDKYNLFKTMAHEVEKQWLAFNQQKKNLVDKIKRLSDESAIEKAYDEMNMMLWKQYTNYNKAYASLQANMAKETTLKKLRVIKQNLSKYFRYQNYQKAKDSYARQMMEKFGHILPPEDWLDVNGRVTYLSITKVIKEQMRLKVKEKVLGLPSGLSKEAFLAQMPVKEKIAEALRQYDILIPKEFNYTYIEFKKYYEVMVSKKRQKIYNIFYDELESKIGENDLKLNSTWKDFIYSEYLTQKLKTKGIENIELYQKVLYSKELGNFETMIYRPKAQALASKKIIHNYEDFYTDNDIVKKGDDAIKLLYIPPIALTLSILALLLNLVTIVYMLLRLVGINSWFRGVLIVSLMAIIIYFPLVSKEKNLQSEILQKVGNPFLIEVLEWSSYWVRLNYGLND